MFSPTLWMRKRRLREVKQMFKVTSLEPDINQLLLFFWIIASDHPTLQPPPYPPTHGAAALECIRPAGAGGALACLTTSAFTGSLSDGHKSRYSPFPGDVAMRPQPHCSDCPPWRWWPCQHSRRKVSWVSGLFLNNVEIHRWVLERDMSSRNLCPHRRTKPLDEPMRKIQWCFCFESKEGKTPLD